MPENQRLEFQPRIHLCDYIAQVADSDTTCNGIKWERVQG